MLLTNFLPDHLLRRQDSNMRPPGYEPGELPTAPHRDIINSFLNCECKGTTFFDNRQIFLAKSYIINSILTVNNKYSSINTKNHRKKLIKGRLSRINKIDRKQKSDLS